MAEEKTSERLRRALALIESEEHWCKGSYQKGAGLSARFCAAGAVYTSGIESPCRSTDNEMKALSQAFAERFPVIPDGWDTHAHPEVMVVHCNDHLAEHQDVVNAFEKAIAACEERGE